MKLLDDLIFKHIYMYCHYFTGFRRKPSQLPNKLSKWKRTLVSLEIKIHLKKKRKHNYSELILPNIMYS